MRLVEDGGKVVPYHFAAEHEFAHRWHVDGQAECAVQTRPPAASPFHPRVTCDVTIHVCVTDVQEGDTQCVGFI